MRDCHLVVPSDCVASNTHEETDYALKQIAQVLKGEVPPSPEIDFLALVAAASTPARRRGTAPTRDLNRS